MAGLNSSIKSLLDSVRDRAQWLCSCLFLFCVMVGLLIVILLHLEVFPNVQDTRCKCVCPHNHYATSNRTVFVQLIDSSHECVCRLIVPSADETLCSRCTCTFETRNNFLVKFVIVSMMLLVLILMIATSIFSIIKIRSKYTDSLRRGYESISSEDNDREPMINSGNIQVHRMKRRNRQTT